ncbi:unnamed protein product (macronuclear) [Paramecium tetraurelia]|uniref:RING-type domain-containing protein n=1 Tax=Paramecium tetraurelia TaxID=5888 RepID=A0CGZ1_PARTE|nr:uncharacterized protein GSPATT00007498001 [Paramecium tetraurelia]CAK70058.1 unnamed protein product [Paramecium tetraurelia]|eukprot:XP_001437455.1 hypothetical protein (macronuclear) [Paramecium tetraurelia strain d4-2]
MIHASEEHIEQVADLQLINKNMLQETFLKKMRKRENIKQNYTERRKKIKLQQHSRPKFEDLICPICLEIFQKVTTTQCGHAFCEMCIFDSLMRKAECPVCRVKIKTHSFQYCESFDNRIVDLVNQYGDKAQIEHFQNRRQEMEQWNKSKLVDNMAIDQKVDIMDQQFIWCVATIQQIGKKELFIHYDGWGKEYDEFIPLQSNRIAPLGLYTSREDIPKYQPERRQFAEILEFINQHGELSTQNILPD